MRGPDVGFLGFLERGPIRVTIRGFRVWGLGFRGLGFL